MQVFPGIIPGYHFPRSLMWVPQIPCYHEHKSCINQKQAAALKLGTFNADLLWLRRLQVSSVDGEAEGGSLLESRMSSGEWNDRQGNGIGPNGERDSRRRGPYNNSRGEAEMTPLIQQQR